MSSAPNVASTATIASRTIELRLHRFVTKPATLCAPNSNRVMPVIPVAVKSLLHHNYIAKFGEDPPDPCSFDLATRLTAGPDWRLRNDGGSDVESKRIISNELGKGFARWFCYEHLGFTFFCPLEHLLDVKNVDGSYWTRLTSGDLPDYVCGPDALHVNLLEAKGRFSSVGFKTVKFAEWRAQIGRTALLDGSGNAISVKGYVSAIRLARETRPRVRARLSVEDPRTDGRILGEGDLPKAIGTAMLAGHYAPVLSALSLPLHSDAIRRGGGALKRTGTRRGVWRCVRGPLKGRKFVGGIVAEPGAHLAWPPWCEPHVHPATGADGRTFPLFLAPPPRFFGVEQQVFGRVLAVAREGLDSDTMFETVSVPEDTGSLSLHRDGTVYGPVHYFEPADVLEL